MSQGRLRGGRQRGSMKSRPGTPQKRRTSSRYLGVDGKTQEMESTAFQLEHQAHESPEHKYSSGDAPPVDDADLVLGSDELEMLKVGAGSSCLSARTVGVAVCIPCVCVWARRPSHSRACSQAFHAVIGLPSIRLGLCNPVADTDLEVEDDTPESKCDLVVDGDGASVGSAASVVSEVADELAHMHMEPHDGPYVHHK